MGISARRAASLRRSLSSAGMLLLVSIQSHAESSERARFDDARPALERLVRSLKPEPQGAQHFCVVAYAAEGGYAWVHWRERNRLIFWQGAVAGANPDDSIVGSARNLDLAKDVVSHQEDVAGSTYLVTRGWVKDRLADCRKRGKHYIVGGS